MALPPAGARGRRRAQGAGSLAQSWRCAFLPRPRPLSSVLPAQPAAGSRGRRATPGAAAGLRSRPLLCVSEVKPENIPLQPFRGAVRPPGKAVHAEPRWVLVGARGELPRQGAARAAHATSHRCRPLAGVTPVPSGRGQALPHAGLALLHTRAGRFPTGPAALPPPALHPWSRQPHPCPCSRLGSGGLFGSGAVSYCYRPHVS